MPSKIDYLATYYPFRKSPPHASYYPVITNVQATSSGLITWTTDVPSTSQVQYGTLPLLGQITDRDSTLVTSHSVQIAGLLPNTYYYFKVQSFNQDSLSISELYVFLNINVYSAFILLSPDGTRWAVVPLPVTGNLYSIQTPTGPAGAYDVGGPVFIDSNNVTWATTISNSGNLITTVVGFHGVPLASLSINDSNGHPWAVSINTSGDLITT